jgi:prolipoprotein diacylglyceryltransferase
MSLRFLPSSIHSFVIAVVIVILLFYSMKEWREKKLFSSGLFLIAIGLAFLIYEKQFFKSANDLSDIFVLIGGILGITGGILIISVQYKSLPQDSPQRKEIKKYALTILGVVLITTILVILSL